MEPTDQELYDQLLGYLAAERAIEEDESEDLVVLTEFDHRALEQPLRLHITPGSLGRHLREASSDAAGLYPDVHPLEAAWRLFTVHLDEAVQTARPGETELVLARNGVTSLRPDGTRTPLAPEVEAHIALDAFRERLIDHLADRGDVEVTGDVLVMHALDQQVFEPPLRLRIAGEELGRQLRLADDPEARWGSIVQQIDAMARSADPREVELAVGAGGVISRRV